MTHRNKLSSLCGVATGTPNKTTQFLQEILQEILQSPENFGKSAGRQFFFSPLHHPRTAQDYY
jgi:ATP-dependent DNA ligase